MSVATVQANYQVFQPSYTRLDTEPSLAEKWTMTTSKRIAREYGGQLLDSLVKFESKPFAALAQKTAPLTSKARGYHHIAGINVKLLKLAPNPFTQKGMSSLKVAYKANFRQLSFKPDSYVTKTLIADNLKSITQPLLQGKVFLSMARILGPVMSVIPAITQTLNTYQTTQSITSAAKVAGKESVKAVIAWEAGAIGALVGTLLFPAAGPICALTSIVMGGLFSATAYKLTH